MLMSPQVVTQRAYFYVYLYNNIIWSVTQVCRQVGCLPDGELHLPLILTPLHDLRVQICQGS